MSGTPRRKEEEKGHTGCWLWGLAILCCGSGRPGKRLLVMKTDDVCLWGRTRDEVVDQTFQHQIIIVETSLRHPGIAASLHPYIPAAHHIPGRSPLLSCRWLFPRPQTRIRTGMYRRIPPENGSLCSETASGIWTTIPQYTDVPVRRAQEPLLSRWVMLTFGKHTICSHPSSRIGCAMIIGNLQSLGGPSRVVGGGPKMDLAVQILWCNVALLRSEALDIRASPSGRSEHSLAGHLPALATSAWKPVAGGT